MCGSLVSRKLRNLVFERLMMLYTVKFAFLDEFWGVLSDKTSERWSAVLFLRRVNGLMFA